MHRFLIVSQDAFPQAEDCERGPEPMPITTFCHSPPLPVCAVKWHIVDLVRLSLTLSAALIDHLGCSSVSCLPRPKSLQVFPRCEKALATRHMGTAWLLFTPLPAGATGPGKGLPLPHPGRRTNTGSPGTSGRGSHGSRPELTPLPPTGSAWAGEAPCQAPPLAPQTPN